MSESMAFIWHLPPLHGAASGPRLGTRPSLSDSEAAARGRSPRPAGIRSWAISKSGAVYCDYSFSTRLLRLLFGLLRLLLSIIQMDYCGLLRVPLFSDYYDYCVLIIATIDFRVDYSDYSDYSYSCRLLFSIWIIRIIVIICNNPNNLNNQSSKQ